MEENNVPVNDKKGFSIASMVLGICSIALCYPLITIPCGIVGLVLGIMSQNKSSKPGMTKAGIITSIIGLGLAVLLIIFAVIGVLGSFGYNYNYYY